MILVFKKGVKYTTSNKGDSNLFPIMQLPLDKRGDETDLNDFQWWSYTEDWNKWLKKNPREWQAESIEDTEEFSYERLLESLLERKSAEISLISERLTDLTEDGKFVTFGKYNSLLEANSDEGSKGTLKKYVKLGYAIGALTESGEIKSTLNIEDLNKGTPYGVIIDQIDDEGNINENARQVVKITTLNEKGQVILAEMDESIPLGKIEDPGTFVEKTNDYTRDVAIGLLGIGATWLTAKGIVTLYSGWKAYKLAGGIYKNFGKAKAGMNILRHTFPIMTSRLGGVGGKANASKGAWTTLKNFAKHGGKKVVTKPGAKTAGTFIRKGVAYSFKNGGTKLGGAASKAVFKKAGSKAAGRLTAKTMAKVAGKGISKVAAATATRLGLATNPVGWVVLAGIEAAGGIQRIYNWVSSNQAPTYTKVKDFAQKKFNPAQIPSGKPITICWTMDEKDTLYGIAQGIVNTSSDTRTTMDLVKIGEFDDRSIFILVNINSKSYEKLLKSNDLIMLAFDNSDIFERGLLDNDDLEFETIRIPDMTEYTWTTAFGGYGGWEEIRDAYQNAPDTPFMVPEAAKTTYEFNYKDGKGDDVNVRGKLIDQKNLELMDAYDIFPIDRKAKVVNENDEFEEATSKSLYSFDTFNASISEKEEAKNEKKEFKTDDPWAKEYIKNVEESNVHVNLDYEQSVVIAYMVEEKEFVNPEKSGKVGTYKYFTVSPDSLNPIKNAAVGVEVTSMDPVIDPRYGLVEFENKPDEDPDKEEKEDVEIDPIEREEDADESGKIVKTTRGDVKIKEKKNSLTIKDEQVSGGVNVFDMFASEELKELLGIQGWKEITSAKIRYGREDKPIRVIIKNRFAKPGDRIIRIKPGDQGFKEAVDFVKDIEDGIQYE